MRFGLDIAQQRMPWPELASRAQLADGLGFDGIWGFDHFQPMYGDGPGECFEGNTTLAAWSGITEQVRLGLLVTGMTYRHPAVFAAEAITIDHASISRASDSSSPSSESDAARRISDGSRPAASAIPLSRRDFSVCSSTPPNACHTSA